VWCSEKKKEGKGNASFMIHPIHHTIARSCIFFSLNEFKAARFKASIYYVSSHLFFHLIHEQLTTHHIDITKPPER